MEDKKYEEVGENYRFFLGWRHATFAGWLVIVYGVITLTASIYKENQKVAAIIPLLAGFASLLLQIIDVRTRELYHAAIRAGKSLEGEGGGFYTELSKDILPPGSVPLRNKRATHSKAIDFLFFGSTILLFLAAIGLFILTFMFE